MRPENNTRCIQVPVTLFNSRSKHCQNVFATALLNKLSFKADVNSVKFWKPKEPLLTHAVCNSNPGWTEGISELRHSFKRIPHTTALATALKGETDNKKVVHLAITAEGSYHARGDNVATELPEVQSYLKIVATPGVSPSVGAKEYGSLQTHPNEAIYDGRYPLRATLSTAARPVQIFNPVFTKFTQLLDSAQPNNDDLRQAQMFMHVLTDVGMDNSTREYHFDEKLTNILHRDIRAGPIDDCSSVILLRVNDKSIPLMSVEVQDELGDARCDPSNQAGLIMKRLWIQSTYEEIRDKCCCPTLMLVGGGPWLGVLGGVFTDEVIVQRLTDMMWFARSSTQEDHRVYRLARVSVALRECLNDLETFYLSEVCQRPTLQRGRTHLRFYPYPTSYTDETGKVVNFQYIRRLDEYAACVTYQAKISSVDLPNNPALAMISWSSLSPDTVPKSTRSEAKHGHAPRLLYCGPLSGIAVQSRSPDPESLTKPPPGLELGPLQMVVMDYIYSPARKKAPADAHQQLETVLVKLHSNGYVFGDIRLQNMLFDEKDEVKFIDFNWAVRTTLGSEYDNIKSDGDDYALYPLNLSKNIVWAEGVRELEPILPKHDREMLKSMFYHYGILMLH